MLFDSFRNGFKAFQRLKNHFKDLVIVDTESFLIPLETNSNFLKKNSYKQDLIIITSYFPVLSLHECISKLKEATSSKIKYFPENSTVKSMLFW